MTQVSLLISASRRRMTSWSAASLFALFVLALTPGVADALCYCMLRPPPPTSQTRGIAEDPSYSPTSAVVIVRDGRKIILTIEAAYKGPSVELSMVIPIPTSIERDAVRTITGTAFRRLDQRTAPRVRHVWPPCPPRPMRRAMAMDGMGGGGGGGGAAPLRTLDEFGVEIQDEWPVDEYDVTLLGASESSGLLAFLRQRGLDLPDRAATMLRGYIETGHRFVLLRADPSRAQHLGDNMMLSPIQLEYESDDLVVPVRLGTLNSPGEQELLLYVFSPEGRFAVANRPNVEAPTDLRMRRDARGTFAELYTSITDEVFRHTPNAAVTEYAHVLGRHVRFGDAAPFGVPNEGASPLRRGDRASARRIWTVSRMRHRYGAHLTDDLTLQRAEPIRLTRRWPRYPALRNSVAAGQSGFHVQYIVEHTGCTDEWTQRRIARRWATAESMWESSHDLWPGSVLLDPIDSLGIEPGSAPPANWPPPPPPPPAPEPAAQPAAAQPAAQAPAPAAQAPAASAQPAIEATSPSTPAAPPPAETSSCAVGRRSTASPAWLFAIVLAEVTRRRRATRHRKR